MTFGDVMLNAWMFVGWCLATVMFGRARYWKRIAKMNRAEIERATQIIETATQIVNSRYQAQAKTGEEWPDEIEDTRK